MKMLILVRWYAFMECVVKKWGVGSLALGDVGF